MKSNGKRLEAGDIQHELAVWRQLMWTSDQGGWIIEHPGKPSDSIPDAFLIATAFQSSPKFGLMLKLEMLVCKFAYSLESSTQRHENVSRCNLQYLPLHGGCNMDPTLTASSMAWPSWMYM